MKTQFPRRRCARAASRVVLRCVCVTLTLVLSGCPAERDDRSNPSAQPAYRAPQATQAVLLDGTRGGDTIVVVGERGIALASRDGGQHWDQGQVPLRFTLTAVFMYDAQLGWAVGADATVLRTTDGGRSWSVQNTAPEEGTLLLDVWFADPSRGFAVGAYGTFLVTSDGGQTWTSRDFVAPPVRIGGPSSVVQADAAREADDTEGADIWEDIEGPLAFHLNRIAVASDGTLYIAAEAGHIFRSDDSGENWTVLPSPYEGSFFALLALEGDAVFAVGFEGHIFRSEDRGNSWTEIPSGTAATLTRSARLADGTVVVAGPDGTLLSSSDDARSFTLHGSADLIGTYALLGVDGDYLLVIGKDGVRRMAISEALGDAVQ